MADREISIRGAGFKELFRIPNGGYLKICVDGVESIRECKFIDEFHFYLGSECLHIDQFAGYVVRNGLSVQPAEPEIVAGYRITDRRSAGDIGFVMAHNPGAAQPWVTWQQCERGYEHGHYFARRADADTDLFRRVDAARNGTVYLPKPSKSRDRGLEP